MELNSYIPVCGMAASYTIRRLSPEMNLAEFGSEDLNNFHVTIHPFF